VNRPGNYQPNPPLSLFLGPCVKAPFLPISDSPAPSVPAPLPLSPFPKIPLSQNSPFPVSIFPSPILRFPVSQAQSFLSDSPFPRLTVSPFHPFHLRLNFCTSPLLSFFPLSASACSAQIPKWSFEPESAKNLPDGSLIRTLPIMVQAACVPSLSELPACLDRHRIPWRQVPSRQPGIKMSLRTEGEDRSSGIADVFPKPGNRHHKVNEPI